MKKETSSSLINDSLYEILISSVLNNMPGHFYWKNIEGVYLGCNDKQAKSLGLESGKEVIGKTDFELPWPSGSAAQFRENDLRIINSGKASITEENSTIDGKPGTVLSIKAPLKDGKNNIQGILGISIDITEQKRLEKELQNSKEELEFANTYKTQFIDNMQHDIRTPVAGMAATAKYLAENPDSPDRLKYINMIQRASRSFLYFCDEIFAFKELTQGKVPTIISQQHVRAFIDDVISLSETTALKKMIALNAYINEQVPAAVNMDEPRLKRILVNLLGNALKFTPNGGTVSLHVNAKKIKDGKVTLQFEVTDTGIGFDMAEKDHIFERFVRLNRSNQEKYKGSGLGLSIVKDYIGDMGGNIDVQSEVGKGTTFTVTLVLDIVDTTQQDNQVAAQARMPSSRQHIHVLFIEDDFIAQFMGQKNLEKLGVCVEVAGDVQTAKELLCKKQYHFVLSDLGLPDGKGTDIVTWTKSHPVHLNSNTPFVALTAHSAPETVQHARDCGFLEVLQKPFPEEDIARLIDTYAPVHQPQQRTKSTGEEEIQQKLSSPVDNLPKDILDIPATLDGSCRGDREMFRIILRLLWEELPQDLLSLEKFCAANDVEMTRKLLHRLDGALRICITPRLQRARAELHEAVKNTDKLSNLDSLYKKLFIEMDYFLKLYEKLRNDDFI